MYQFFKLTGLYESKFMLLVYVIQNEKGERWEYVTAEQHFTLPWISYF